MIFGIDLNTTDPEQSPQLLHQIDELDSSQWSVAYDIITARSGALVNSSEVWATWETFEAHLHDDTLDITFNHIDDDTCVDELSFMVQPAIDMLIGPVTRAKEQG